MSNDGSRVIQYFAITAAWAGEKELALQQLELDFVLPPRQHAELRRLETVPVLGPAPRRSALRENRRLAGAEMIEIDARHSGRKTQVSWRRLY